MNKNFDLLRICSKWTEFVLENTRQLDSFVSVERHGIDQATCFPWQFLWPYTAFKLWLYKFPGKKAQGTFVL